MAQSNGLIKNLLICTDDLAALEDMVKQGINADLIYLDKVPEVYDGGL